MITKPVAGIPIPSKHSKYPFHAMAVGDSFLVTVPDGSSLHTLRRFHSAVCQAIWRLKEMQFTSRRVPGGIRVWRVE